MMKQPFFKQLLMLAVLLFAGIGSAFAEIKTINVENLDGSNQPIEDVEIQYNTITLYRDGNLSSVWLYEFNEDIMIEPSEISDDKIVWKTVSGQSYYLEYHPNNGITYRVESIKVDEETFDNEDYFELINNTSDHEITLEIRINGDGENVEFKTITVNFSDFYDEENQLKGHLQFMDDYRGWCTADYATNEFLNDNRIGMRVWTKLGYKVTRVILDGTKDVTNTYLMKGYIDFSDTNNHTVNVEFSKVNFYPITIEVNNGSINLNDNWCTSDGDMFFNEGTVVTLQLPATYESNKKLYVPSLPITIDNEEVTPAKNESGDYVYTFDNGSFARSHAVKVNFTEVPSYAIKVNYEKGWFHINDQYIYSEEERQCETNSTVKMTFPSSVWEGNLQYITSSVTVTAEGGSPVQVDLDALSLDDDDNYEYTFQLTANTTIDVTFVVIPRYEIKVNSDCGEVILNGYWASDGEICLFKQGENVKLTLWGIGRDRSLKSLKVNETEVTDLYLAQGYYMIENLSADMEITVESEYADIYYIDHNNFNGTICLESTLTGQVNGGSEFIKGSSVTMTVKPAIGYEVAKIILFNEDGDVDITNDYKSNGNKYVLEDLSSDQYFVITTQKKTNSPSSVSFTLDESGMATFCSEYDLDFSSLSDISAYIAIGFSSETGKLMMQKVTEVQVGTGVLIVGKPGSYSIPTKQTSLYYHNMLKVVAEDQTISDIDWSDRYPYYNYVLANGKFNRVDDETPISAYQAYLQVTTNVALDTETISLEFVDMGDMNNDKKVTITDAVMILDQILTNQ